jgi:uncharacterized protein YndB with AHSA1/START domain
MRRKGTAWQTGVVEDLDTLFGGFVVEVSMRIDASPEDVWDLVTNVSRVPEFSPEVVRATWVEGGPQEPVIHARFAGTNKLADFEWTRVCTVVAADRPRVFAYTVGDRFDGSPSGTWTFECEADEEGTVVRQRFAHAPEGRSGTRLLAEQDPAKAAAIIETRRGILERGMASTLEAIKNVLERG